jgi:cellobiose epimerase
MKERAKPQRTKRKKVSMRIRPLAAAALTTGLLLVMCGQRKSDQKISREIEHALTAKFLECWYPRAVDEECGGFLSTFDADWKPTGPQYKAEVNQARHVWTTSQAAVYYPDNPTYRKAAEQGFRFLKEKMWDPRYGGFFQLLDRQGRLDDSLTYRDEKRSYGNAFGIYACAAYFRMSGDTSALHLAQKTFRWLDAGARDPVHGGYFQNLDRKGKPVRPGDASAAGWDRGTAGLKDYNSSIHLLEAFTALYQVWPDSLVRNRLNEMFHLIRDTVVCPAGYMRLYFRPDWKTISYGDSSDAVRNSHFALDHVSFGHDMETAFLLIEASEALGMKNDGATIQVARRLIDHSLRAGWDSRRGGIYYEGYYFPGRDSITIINDKKDWWVQAEALHSLLLMSRLFPDDSPYRRCFEMEWKYIRKNIIDAERGGWYEGGIDSHPEYMKALKGSEWKATYHETRSMLNCLNLLDPHRVPK